ncbi:hypothetical protein NKG05_16030 [Oerskovia sp. M15]
MGVRGAASGAVSVADAHLASTRPLDPTRHRLHRLHRLHRFDVVHKVALVHRSDGDRPRAPLYGHALGHDLPAARPSCPEIPRVPSAGHRPGRPGPATLLQAALAEGLLEKVRHGAYRLREVDEPVTGHVVDRRRAHARLEAVSRQLRAPFVFCQDSAALLWDLPLWRTPARVHVVQRNRPARTATGSDLVRHLAVLPATDGAVRRGLPVTSLARTVVDCARALPSLDALVVADAALHRGLPGSSCMPPSTGRETDGDCASTRRRPARGPGSGVARRVGGPVPPPASRASRTEHADRRGHATRDVPRRPRLARVAGARRVRRVREVLGPCTRDPRGCSSRRSAAKRRSRRRGGGCSA